MTIEWRDAMSLGDATLDADHKTILSLLNTAEDFARDGKTEKLGEILGTTQKYLSEHFLREEAVMLEIGFPLLNEQKSFHEKTKNVISGIKQKYNEAKTPEETHAAASMISNFLKVYFINHIIKQDLKLKPYIQKKNSAFSKSNPSQSFFASFGKSVLVVDDIDFMRKQIQRILREAGVSNLVEADEGGRAFELLRAAPHQYGLVISDLDMNPTSGLHLLTLLRNDEMTPPEIRNIPFIMLSSDDGKRGIANLLKAGANEVLVKPFTGVSLLASAQRALKS